MLRSIASRIPLRRSVHTSAARFPSARRLRRVGTALGASAAVAYLAWKSETIALDAATPASKRGTHQTPRSAEPGPVAPESESSSHEKHDVSPNTAHDASSSEAISAPSSSSSQDPVGEAVEEVQDDGGGGAYNPVTGEINWDCSCLGGMAHGPCGMQFREAFSCFVHSEEEPKGIDCVEKFKAMQNCFRENPDVYGDEIMDDDDDEPVESASGVVDAPTSQSSASPFVAGQEPSQPGESVHKKEVAMSDSSIAGP